MIPAIKSKVAIIAKIHNVYSTHFFIVNVFKLLLGFKSFATIPVFAQTR